MIDVLKLVVTLSPRSAQLWRSGRPEPHHYDPRATDRIIDALGILLDALQLHSPPGQVTIEPRRGQVSITHGAGSRAVVGAELAALPRVAIDGPLAVARREAGDSEAIEQAGALVGEAAFWSSRYRANEMGWDLGFAAPALLRAFAHLRPARAVVVGCGQGHEVRALATLGFEAVGVDFSSEAVTRARALSLKEGPRASFAQADALTLPGELGTFDYWIEHTCFCAIDPARRDDYVAAAARSVKPGGALVGLFYAHGRPSGPPYTTDEAEVRRRFAPHFELASLEVPPDSIERRAGQELLVHFTRRATA